MHITRSWQYKCILHAIILIMLMTSIPPTKISVAYEYMTKLIVIHFFTSWWCYQCPFKSIIMLAFKKKIIFIWNSYCRMHIKIIMKPNDPTLGTYERNGMVYQCLSVLSTSLLLYVFNLRYMCRRIHISHIISVGTWCNNFNPS